MSFQNILWFGKSAFEGGLSLENVEFCTMPYSAAMVWSRSYEQNLSYLLPKANALLDLVNSKLSPFIEASKLSDLDIMYVNEDGSVASTSGHVEDSKATEPPKPPVQEEEAQPPAYTFDEYGNVIDPETGQILYYVDVDGNLIHPDTGEIVGSTNGGSGDEPSVDEEQPEVSEGEEPPETDVPETEQGEPPVTQQPDGVQGLDPITGEPLPPPEEAPSEPDIQPEEPVIPEEPAEPENVPAE